MPLHLDLCRRGSVLLLLLLTASAVPAVELRSITDVTSIDTYRVEALYHMGETPPVQIVEVDGVYGRDPARHDLRITVTERERKPVTILGRRIGGQLYVNPAGRWAKTTKFHYDELIVLAPGQLLGIENRLEDLGTEDQNGRLLRHLRGDKDDLVAVCGSSTSLDFSRVDAAILDLWADESEGFIVKFHITGQTRMGDGFLPFDFAYEYKDFNQPIVIETPVLADIPEVVMPPALTQADVSHKLGFEFPVPEGAHISIYGATVVIITAMPLAEARQYAEAAMRKVGFTPNKVEETAPGEFHTDYTRDKRSLGVMVFQVNEKGATIKVGTIK